MGESILTAARSAAEPVSWVLLHSLWVGGVIAILLAVVTNLLSTRQPQIRYALAGLAMMLVLPASVSIVVYDAAGQNIATISEAAVESDASGQVYSPVETAASQQGGATVWSTLAQFQNAHQDKAAPWILLIWIIGISAISIYHLAGWRHARLLLQSNSYPVPESWQKRFIRLCGRAGIGRAIELLSSSRVKMPCVVGWIKPTILMPISVFSGLAAEDIDMILAHELAHVHRHDVLMNYAQTVIETLLFFNPAIWWISRQIRIERENCCDDMAVAITGDRLAYARALTNLEGMRSVRPHMAPAVDGTSLLKRVRRLIGSNACAPRWPGVKAVTVLSLAAILSIGFLVSAMLSEVNAADNQGPDITGVYEEKDDDLHGYWDVESHDDGISLAMEFGRRERSSFWLYPEDLNGFSEGSKIQFQLVRDAGTFFFVGDVEKDGLDYFGEGECHFRPNPDYIEQMKKLGYRIRSPREALTLAVHNVELSFARGINDAGYDGISLDRLVELHIHRVTPEFIAELGDLGYRNLSLDRLVEMRIHRATPEYIRELKEVGYTDLDPEDLVTMRIHNVDPDYIRGFSEQGMRDISADKLVEMSIHRVNPAFVRELKKLGYDRIDPSRLVEMQIHRVDPEYIGRLAELGLKDIDISDLVSMRIHRVEPLYIEKLIELGYDDISPDDLVSMRIHDVSIDFIKDLQDRGYDNLSPERLVSIKINGIDRKRPRRSTSY